MNRRGFFGTLAACLIVKRVAPTTPQINFRLDGADLVSPEVRTIIEGKPGHRIYFLSNDGPYVIGGSPNHVEKISLDTFAAPTVPPSH
jgi:hypothetical protein